MRIRQSVCYPMFKPESMSLDTLFQAAARVGYEAMEFWHRDEHSDEAIALAKRYGLQVAVMCAHQSLTDGLVNYASHGRIEAEILASIDYAQRHQIRGLICLAGNRVPHQSDAQAIDACADILKRVAPVAEKKGINLNLELLNSKIDHPGYQCDHTAWGLAVVHRVASPRVKLLYDVYHMQIMEGDIIRTIRENVNWIGHFHTAGNPGRNDMDDTQEINYRGICRAIAASGYDLFVGHEFKPKADAIEALRKTYETCNQ